MKSFLAALMMFTRLPLWRIVQVEKKYYSTILLSWPLVGFLTGLTTWFTLWLGTCIMPLLPACILAITARLLLTGALHEDGLADFFDGFGGGTDKEKILTIMKDSHIGSYGTIGLILYFLLYTGFLSSCPSVIIIISADVSAKLCSAIMINSLCYARTEETCKAHVIYKRLSGWAFTGMVVLCASLLFIIYILSQPTIPQLQNILLSPIIIIIPVVLFVLGLRHYFQRKIGGYTGDCCGAAMLLTEQFFYLSYIVYLQLPI